MAEIHFECVQIYMPYVSGTCTLPVDKFWPEGYHTPLTCQEASNGTWCYSFTTSRIGVPDLVGFRPVDKVNGGTINRAIPDCIKLKSINETTPKLQNESGLASRGGFTCSFVDFDGDPGPINKTDKGTYFSKLIARNIIENRDVYLDKYKIVDGVISLVSSSHYFVDSFTVGSNGVYTLRAKSNLERTHKRNLKFPAPTGARLRQDIDQATIAIPVFGNGVEYGANWQAGQVIRCGNEFMKINSVSGSGNDAILNVPARGSTINGSLVPLSITEAESHDAGDDIQICHVSNEQTIGSLIQDILITCEIPQSYIPINDWNAELADYWANYTVNTLFSDPEDGKDLIDTIAKDFMLDIWEDPTTSTIKLSAVSVWKASATQLAIGRGIEYGTLRGKQESNLRTSLTRIRHDKRDKAANNDIESYRKVAFYEDNQYDGVDFYGREKIVELDSSPIHTTQSASIRTQRNTVRFSITPRSVHFECQEKYLNFSTGDVVTLPSGTVEADGSPNTIRCQIQQVKPRYNSIGRYYDIQGLSYLPAFGGDTGGGNPGGGPGGDPAEGQLVVTLSGNLLDVDLWVQSGAISSPVDFLVIFDGATIGSTDVNIPAVSATGFNPASNVTIVCINDCKWSARGGDGGNATGDVDTDIVIYDPTPGGNCIDSGSVSTAIYLAGDYTGDNGETYNASGWLRAPGGGGGSITKKYVSSGLVYTDLATGGGGQGINGGKGGTGATGGNTSPIFGTPDRVYGSDGTINGPGQGRINAALPPDYIESGDGGSWGQSGDDPEFLNNTPSLNTITTKPGAPAGAAVKGSNVTVYFEYSSFDYGPGLTVGNSDSFNDVSV